MAKSKRKACDVKRVAPKQLWDMFHDAFGNDGISPYEFDRLGPKFNKDLGKVNFDFENFYFDHLEEEIGKADGLLGFRKFWTRSPLSCFSFIGWSAGGDWEYPLNFIVYLDQDGKTWRAYIPQDGNVWNYKTKEAIGNDEDADSKFIGDWIKKNKPELVDVAWDEQEDGPLEYDVEDAEVMFDPLKIAHEMMFRFEAV